MFSLQNTLVSGSLITWIGVNMSPKSLPKQLRHLVSFEGTWLLHLGVLLGRVAQSVMCLATDACLTADSGVASSIPARSHTFVEIDHERFLRSFSSLPLIHSRRVVVSYKRKYVHKLLVNRLLKPAQEKSVVK